MEKPFFTAKARSGLLISVLLAVFVLVIYSQTVGFDFVNLDDPSFVVNNYNLTKGFSKENILWALTSANDISKYYIPVTWFSFILDYQLYGLNPGGFHFTNLLLHLANSILVFACLFKLTRRLYPCALVAVLFAVHPLHVESVAWISERKDVLSAFFFWLTILSYQYYAKTPGIRRFLIVMSLFLIGILSKPMLVTLPFILLLLDFWPLERLRLDLPPRVKSAKALKLVGEKIPFFLIISIFSIMAYLTQKKGHAVTPFDVYPLLMRIENLFYAYLVYLKKMIWPADLAVHYPYPGQLPYWIVLSSAAVFLFICVYSIKQVNRSPFITAGWLWYVITLLPVIGIIIIGPYLVADRYAYISLIGIYIIIAWSLDGFIKKFPSLKKITAAAVIGVVLMFAFLSWNQAGYWKNSGTLFKRAIRVNPENSVAHHNLASYYDKSKKYGKAVEHYLMAIQISPNYVQAYYNLGNTFLKHQAYRKAVRYFSKAVELNPKHALAYNHLGVAYAYLERFNQSITCFKKALKIDPQYTKAKINLGLVLKEIH